MFLVKFVKVEKKPTGLYQNHRGKEKNKLYSLNENWINVESIKSAEANERYGMDLKKGYFPEGLPENTKFTTLYLLDGDVINIVGSPEDVQKKCASQAKTLLKG